MMTISSWEESFSHIVSLALAYALALPVGWNREKDERSAGIRTFPLVAIASCGFVLVGIAILGRTSPAQARLLEGLITGVGFIGGGAILKHAGKASGTRSDEHTSELQSLMRISYAVFCLKKKKQKK